MVTCEVLYIHSTKNPTNKDATRYNIMPMGIIGILNKLKSNGIDVVGVNYGIEELLDSQWDLVTFLENAQYKVLLTDLHWYEHSFGSMYVARQAKKVHPDRPVVIGGYTSTIFADEIMENFPSVDYLVSGDSDLPMELLIDHLLGRRDIQPEDIPNLRFRRGAEVVRSGKTWVQTSLDEIDFIHTDLFLHSECIAHTAIKGIRERRSSYWLCIARGCKYNCAYCCGAKDNMQSLFNRCNVLTRSPQKVAEDFRELTAAGIKQISPSHDFQMFGKKYYEEVFEEIRKTGVKPGMYLECFQLPTKEYIDDMLRTFNSNELILVLSPISGNEEQRRKNGKLFSNEAMMDVLHYMISKKIKVQLYYTLNIYKETEKQFMDTFVQMKYLRLMFGLNRANVFYQRVIVDPLAGMRDFEGIQVEYNSFMDYYNYCQLPPDDKYEATGFDDCGEVPYEKKLEMYDSIFN